MYQRELIRRFALAISACLLAMAPCLAQSNLASISGIVTDPQGAVIPQARITATNTATGVATAVSSNSTGFYNIQNLDIGAYDFSAGQAGFRTYIRKEMPLS